MSCVSKMSVPHSVIALLRFHENGLNGKKQKGTNDTEQRLLMMRKLIVTEAKKKNRISLQFILT